MSGFQFTRSTKVGLESEDSYIVVRDGVSFLRILGGEPNWTLMTATASEDGGQTLVCKDQRRLVASASRLCAEFGSRPEISTDHFGREYVIIGRIRRASGENDQDLLNDADDICSKFFEIYDRCEG